MKRVLCFLFICFIAQVVSKNVYAQNTAVYQGLTYYLDKQEAFEAATMQNKRVFLFWGSNSCIRCDGVKRNLATRSVKAILDEHYILWFCDASVYPWDSSEVSDYFSVLDRNPPYPTLCIIDTMDRTTGYGLVSGDQDARSLQAMLNNYVANDHIDGSEKSHNAYISHNNLIVNSAADEDISVYAITGSLIDRFRKAAYHSVARDASSYPAGILLVTGSSGWTRKVVLMKK